MVTVATETAEKVHRRGLPVMDDMNLSGIEFWMNHVMNISEATRHNKLAEILEGYAHKKHSTDIFLIQNSRKKEAAGVISSLGHFVAREKTIKTLEDEVLRLTQEIMLLRTQIRQEQPVYSLAQAIERLELNEDDLTDILMNSDEVKID